MLIQPLSWISKYVAVVWPQVKINLIYTLDYTDLACKVHIEFFAKYANLWGKKIPKLHLLITAVMFVT